MDIPPQPEGVNQLQLLETSQPEFSKKAWIFLAGILSLGLLVIFFYSSSQPSVKGMQDIENSLSGPASSAANPQQQVAGAQTFGVDAPSGTTTPSPTEKTTPTPTPTTEPSATPTPTETPTPTNTPSPTPTHSPTPTPTNTPTPTPTETE